MPSPRRCSSSASAAPEADGALEGKQTGLITRYPVSAFGFLFGMLAMLGIPPTLGFIGRWRLYETAVQIGWPLGRHLHRLVDPRADRLCAGFDRHLVGTAERSRLAAAAEPNSQLKEPLLLQTTIVLLVALILAAGIWPSLLDMLKWGRL